MRAIAFLPILAISLGTPSVAQESTCYGTTIKGRLDNGAKLPFSGPNFTSYGKLPSWAGRTYVHSKVRDIVVETFGLLEADQHGKVYKYGETGLRNGGQFKPHQTHQNGLSVDFLVPVQDKEGHSVSLPTNLLNNYGYRIEFDENGRYGQYQIDFEALGALIVTLHKVAKQHGVGIWRVIFDPRLQPFLYKTSYGNYISKNIEIPKKQSRPRHDEHIHVDFIVECKPI